MAGAAGAALAAPGPATAESCAPGVMPYAGLAGASLTPEQHTSKDQPPVHYVRWRGTVPSFDGMPFSVDVTVPCPGGSRPLVTMVHGFTDDKTVWQETGKSDSVVSTSRPEQNSRWNNIWFASRGYTVLNYTARGWHDTCGPATPGAVPGVAPAPGCLPYKYWIHLGDQRWEVRDLQWLTGGLVQSGVADPARLAVTGGSYGGGPTIMAALLGDQTVCGGSPVPAVLGPDPCAGRADGERVPWTTPDGRTRLLWAAAVPQYTWSDLIQVLAPNGRGSDGWSLAPPPGDPSVPFGVPIASHVAGLFAAGQAAGYFAPAGVDPTADIVTDSARLLAGNPFPASDPLVARGVHLYRQFKSAVGVTPARRVPVFWVQGFTDPLFTGLEAIHTVNRLRAADPNYPIKLFLGDVGHDYTAQRQDEWDLAHAQMSAFLDHYLAGGPAPVFDVGATVTRCLNPTAPMEYVAAPGWHDLHPAHETFVSTTAGVTSSAVVGSAGLATDPITTATLPLPGSYKGCRRVSPAAVDPAAATYQFPLASELVLMGGPVVDLTYATTAPDTELNVRVWDVAGDGSVQALVTRGTYRAVDGPGTGLRARFQIAPNGYRFPAGHVLKVEVAANDAPYYQQSNVPAVLTVERLEVVMPRYVVPAVRAAGATAPAAGSAPASAPAPAGRLPATGGGPPAWAPLAALLVGAAVRAGMRLGAGELKPR